MARGNKGNIKSSNAEFQKRVLIVLEMVVSGMRRREIIQNISENEALKWKVDVRQIDNYIAEAQKEIDKYSEKNKDATYKKCKARLDFLWRKNVAVKDYKAAMLVVDREAKIDGIDAPTKVANTTVDGQDVVTQIGYGNKDKI